MKDRKIVFLWTARVAAVLMLAAWSGCTHDAMTGTAQVYELGWPTDLPKAEAQAQQEKKLVLMDFGGSDWCPDCAQLAKKVYYTPEFKAYAQSNLALVDVDFPEKTPQPAELKTKNEALRKQFGIEGFPTVLVLNGDGKVLDKMLGPEADPAKFIAHLDKLKAGAK